MKRFFTHFFLILITAITFLPNASYANQQLEDTMKKIGQTFKVLGKQLPDASKNSSSAALASDLLPLMNQAHDIMPDSIAAMAEPAKTDAFADYQRLLKDVMDLDQQLVASLKNNDNPGALKIAQAMLDKRKEGHDKYKQD